jgi:hypothetical protein
MLRAALGVLVLLGLAPITWLFERWERGTYGLD